MIEAHQNISSHRAKARAGVAMVKGFGAEDQFFALSYSGTTDNIRYAVAEMRSAIPTLRFIKVRVRENCWKDQLGELQSAVDYELVQKNFVQYM